MNLYPVCVKIIDVMENKLKKIKQNETRLKEMSAEIDSLLIETGNLLIKNGKSGLSDEELLKLNSLTDEIKKIESKRNKLIQYRKRVDDIDSEEKSISQKIKKIESENEKHYIGIGETVFTIYLERADELSEMEPYFVDLNDLVKKIEEIEEKIDNGKINKNSGSPIKKIFSTGSETILESRKKLLTAKFITLYKNLGKKLCNDLFYENTVDDEIKGVFSAFESNNRIIEDFRTKLDSLDAERSNYKVEIEEKEKSLRFGRNIKPEDVITKKTGEKDNILLTAGKIFFENYSKDISIISDGEEDLKKILQDAAAKDNERLLLTIETDRLQTELDIEKKEKEIEKVREIVKNRQERLKDLKKEIDKFNKNAKKLEGEIENLREKLK